MCGLSGLAGNLTTREDDIMKQLLLFSSVRGEDSTGLAGVPIYKNAEIKLAKKVGNVYNLFDSKSFDRIFTGFNCCYIGHNRSKTVGEVKESNAHPFIVDHIVGCHNGTLDTYNKNILDPSREFGTDSEAIISSIAKIGIDETIAKIEKTQAWALTWYDAKQHTINFLRNDKRPLIFCYLNKKQTLAWSSEVMLLMAAITRKGLSPDDKYWEFPENVLYSFEIPATNKEFDKPVKRTIEAKKTYTYQQSQNSYTSTYNSGVGSNRFPIIGTNPPLEAVKRGLNIIEAAENRLKSSSNVVTMTAVDVYRKKKLDESGLQPSDSKVKKIFSSKDLIVYRYPNGEWYSLTYNKDNPTSPWLASMSKNCPDNVPYSVLDINSRHEFKHIGRKKNKRICYAGFNGHLLDKNEFENYMTEGCADCGRVPEWGNKVVFISKQHDFLCEYCAMDESNLNYFLKMASSESEKRA